MTTLSTLIQRLAELEAKATKGPWDSNGIDISPIMDTPPYEPPSLKRYEDAEFIALLRNSFPALLAERQALREALRFYAEIDDYKAPMTGGMGKLYFDVGQTARAALALAHKEVA